MNAGERAPIQARAYFRKMAKAKNILPPDPIFKMPTSSIEQLRIRDEAHKAAQRALPTARSSLDADIVEKERGELIARRKAHNQISFDTYDAERAQIESALDLQRQYAAGKFIAIHS